MYKLKNIIFIDKYFAVNVLKSILQKNKDIFNNYILPMIDNLINNYYQNQNKNWMDKIIAINLILGSMIKTYAAKCIYFSYLFLLSYIN